MRDVMLEVAGKIECISDHILARYITKHSELILDLFTANLHDDSSAREKLLDAMENNLNELANYWKRDWRRPSG